MIYIRKHRGNIIDMSLTKRSDSDNLAEHTVTYFILSNYLELVCCT